MISQLRISLAITAFCALPAFATQQPATRTANNGNVILDGIPDLPSGISE